METTLTCGTPAPPLELQYSCGASNLAQSWRLSADRETSIQHKSAHQDIKPKSLSELATAANCISSDANHGKLSPKRIPGLNCSGKFRLATMEKSSSSMEKPSSGPRDYLSSKLQNKAGYGDGNLESQASDEAKGVSDSVVVKSCNGTKTTSDCNSSGALHGSFKKMKSASTSASTKCQVEGCNADLSEAKDYHRRHKVCECHSKSSKVMVASLEQRFCQQCSRFHVLSEFDEGKRSCRRRLAGHNERRRKQHQEPLSITSFVNHAQFAGRHFGTMKPSPEQLYFRQNKHILQKNMSFDSSYTKGLIDQSDIRNNVKLKNPISGHSSNGLELHQFIQGSSETNLHLGMNHDLKFHNLLDLVAKNDCIVPDLQKPDEISASGRALSLLSSSMSPWNKSSSSPSHADGVLSENPCPTNTCRSFSAGSSPLTTESGRSLDVMPPLYSHGMNISTGSSDFNSSIDILEPYDITPFVDGNSKVVCPSPTLDFLQASSVDRHQQMEIPFTDIKRLSMFGAQTSLM